VRRGGEAGAEAEAEASGAGLGGGADGDPGADASASGADASASGTGGASPDGPDADPGPDGNPGADGAGASASGTCGADADANGAGGAGGANPDSPGGDPGAGASGSGTSTGDADGTAAPTPLSQAPGGTARSAAAALLMVARACPWLLLLCGALTLASGLTTPLVAWETRSIFNTLTAVRHGGGHVFPVGPVVAVCAAGAAGALLPAWLGYLQGQIRRAVVLRVQDELFAAVNRFEGLARFEDPAFHDRLLLAQQNGQAAPAQLVNTVLSLARTAVTISGFAAGVLALSPLMALLAVAAAVPGALVQFTSGRRRAAGVWRTSPLFRRRLLAQSLLTDPRAVREIRAFGLGDFFRARVREDQRLINGIDRAVEARVTRAQSLHGTLGAALTALATAWALWQASRGVFSVGDVTVLLAGAAGIQGAVEGTAGAFSEGHSAALMYDHFRAVANAGPDLPVPERPLPVRSLRRGIEFRDVWFRYTPHGPWVLCGLNLTIPAGSSVAVVGVNGAGKSTLVKLLARMYDPTRGAVLWDGVDIRTVEPAQLRSRMGSVLQDFMTYELTARENIAVGDTARLADHAAHEEAARLSGSHAFLSGLPGGYDTLLSRIQLTNAARSRASSPDVRVVPSGGQWQRIAIARALLRRDRDLLVLDEPSSGLDPHAEAAIHRTLHALRAHSTTLLISHRLGALRDATTIAVLDSGHITELGPHAHLLALNGTYATMFRTQAEGYQPEPADA
jgi:ATP-binding cassette subfamily B protein